MAETGKHLTDNSQSKFDQPIEKWTIFFALLEGENNQPIFVKEMERNKNIKYYKAGTTCMFQNQFLLGNDIMRQTVVIKNEECPVNTNFLNFQLEFPDSFLSINFLPLHFTTQTELTTSTQLGNEIKSSRISYSRSTIPASRYKSYS